MLDFVFFFGRKFKFLNNGVLNLLVKFKKKKNTDLAV